MRESIIVIAVALACGGATAGDTSPAEDPAPRTRLDRLLAPPDPKISRSPEVVTFKAVVTQVLTSAQLADGSRAVRLQIQPVPIEQDPDRQLTVTCLTPSVSSCPSAAGDSGDFSIYREPVEGRLLVQQFEPASSEE